MQIFGLTSKAVTATRKVADEKFDQASRNLDRLAAQREAIREQLSLALKQVIEDGKSDERNH